MGLQVLSMSWIKPFAESSFQLFAGNTVDAFQPLDFFHFFPQWYDLWIERINKCLDTLDVEHKSFLELKPYLPPPSNLRAILVKIIPSYRAFTQKDPAATKRVVEFFVRMLQEGCAGDPFGSNSNPYHSPQEVKVLVEGVAWSDADVGLARKLGQLNTAAGSIVHGLYNDVVTDLGWDVYGPYAVEKDEKVYSMLVRHFPNLSPSELWPESYGASIKELTIYGLYQDVDWKISCVGCHTIPTQGSPVQGLRKYAVVGDGRVLSVKEVEELIQELSQKAESIYREIKKLSFEDLKQKVMLQECYQLMKLFEMGKMDWQPTQDMKDRVIGTSLMTGLLPHGVMMTDQKVYEEVFGIKEFAKEVLGKQI